MNSSKKSAPRLVALAGNPNSGKTTLFNALTGLRYKVANYPGTTVEKKIGLVTFGSPPETITACDLPGIYALSGLSPDEALASQTLRGDRAAGVAPDAVIAVVDGTNLERNLFLVSQIIDTGAPVIVALNLMDLADKLGVRIYPELLSRMLGVPVVEISAKQKRGVGELVNLLISGAARPGKAFQWIPPELEEYRQAAASLGNCIGPSGQPLTMIGSVLLLSESLPPGSAEVQKAVEEQRTRLQSAGLDPQNIEGQYRYRWIREVVSKTCSDNRANTSSLWTGLDWVLTHRVFGLATFLIVMATMFQALFSWSELPVSLIEDGVTWAANWVGSILPDGQLKSLLVDGVLAGVGGVVVFIPQIAILFLFLGILEDSGYLARAAFIVDRILRPFGLQGRSFIPLLSSFACAIPGIMSTRTISSWSDRLTTILIAPLMSCSARLPVYTVLISAVVPERSFLGTFSLRGLSLLGLYLLGIVAALAVAFVLKRTLLRGLPSHFVMEMPPFRRPSVRNIARSVYDSVMSFLKNAGTIILACSIVLWFLASYPRQEGALQAHQVEESYAGTLGHFIEPAIRPLGLNWEFGVAIIGSFAAREVFVSTLATVYNLESSDDAVMSLTDHLSTRYHSRELTLAAAFALLVFYVFACMCTSTLAVCKRETGSWAWTIGMFSYMTLLGYVCALITYQVVLLAMPS